MELPNCLIDDLIFFLHIQPIPGRSFFPICSSFFVNTSGITANLINMFRQISAFFVHPLPVKPC